MNHPTDQPTGGSPRENLHIHPSPSTAAAYCREWSLFADWCTATNRAQLPAPAALIAEFMAAAGVVSESTHRRRLAAISWIHVTNNLPSPVVQSPRFPNPELLAVAVDELLEHVPVWGWPAGIFGRRDALLIVLRFRAGMTLPAIGDLTADRVRVIDQHLVIDDHSVNLPPADDARCCPACIWLRWRSVLELIRRYATTRTLREFLARSDVDQNTEMHRCEQGTAVAVDGPVIMPIDRWGAAPLPRRPATTRTLNSLTVAYRTGDPPHHLTEVSIDDLVEQANGEPRPRLIPPVREPYTEIHRRGIAARRHAVELLAATTADVDDIDQATDELQRRLNQLLNDLLDVRDSITDMHDAR